MKLILIGQGGHSRVVEETADQLNIEVIGYLDDKYSFFDLENDKYIGPIHSVPKLIDLYSDIKFLISIGNNVVRKRIVERLNLSDTYYLTLIHPTAVISRSAEIGAGTVVMAQSIVQTNAKIGQHVIINTGSVIEHDNHLGDFVHLSPNATLTGGVSIEEGAHVGAGATVIPNVGIGSWSVVGAGATVINNVPNKCTAVGVPAKIKVKEDDTFVQHQ
ncbi:acetyltransferase [Bacillus suaedae]|uniref:Acetyltransferase n=1 Tax=Halalkalibacter suaedae TaxID=2822140 RepID=A0A940X040_9BACI|nr:acetyltransferase [Bacillus suaedae]MBP3951519.1 acetyltransferase [Bacillus suaedae]